MSEPEQKWPVTLDESQLQACIIPPGCTHIRFENLEKRPLVTAAIQEALKHQETRLGVKRVVIGYTSLMEDTSILQSFPNVEDVWLEGKRLVQIDTLAALPRLSDLSIAALSSKRSLAVLPRLKLIGLGVQVRKSADLEPVRGCRSVRNLGFSEWPWHSWQELDGMHLKSLSFGRGKLVSATGASAQVEHLYFNSCRRLREVGQVHASEVTVIACPNLDLMTLGQVKGLHKLQVSYGGKVSSVEFVRGCRHLADLSMTATRITPEDVSPMIESNSLRVAWLYAPNDVIAAVGRANPRITICNGSVCYHRGRKVEEREYYQRADEISRGLHGERKQSGKRDCAN